MRRSSCLVMVVSLPALLLIVASVALPRYFAYQRDLNDAKYRQDLILDRDFNKRKHAPLEARVMLGTPFGSFEVEADRPSFQKAIAPLGRLPVILDIAGCEFPSWMEGVPTNVAMLTAYEEPDKVNRMIAPRACETRDVETLRVSYDEQLRFLIDYVRHAPWVDQSRVMLVGSGEATPTVASYAGHLKSRLLLGDPCIVDWSSVYTKAPLTALFITSPQGLAPSGPVPKLNIRAMAMGAGPTFPKVKACQGKPRPKFSPNVKKVLSAGELGMFDRPARLQDALNEAYAAL